MFAKHTRQNYHDLLEGIRIKTLVHGAKTLMTEFLLSKGSILPDHHHPYEQTGYLVSGRILLHIGEIQQEMNPGDSWCIPSDTPHRAEVFEDSVALEVFAPLREDYLRFKG